MKSNFPCVNIESSLQLCLMLKMDKLPLLLDILFSVLFSHIGNEFAIHNILFLGNFKIFLHNKGHSSLLLCFFITEAITDIYGTPPSAMSPSLIRLCGVSSLQSLSYSNKLKLWSKDRIKLIRITLVPPLTFLDPSLIVRS